MKVERQVEFHPITITLETQEEADVMESVLYHGAESDTSGIYRVKAYAMWRAWRDAK